MFNNPLKRYAKQEKEYNSKEAEQFKSQTEKSIDEKSKCLYHYLIEKIEKASKEGQFEIFIPQDEDNEPIFTHKNIRSKVLKQLKDEGFKCRIQVKHRPCLYILWK